MLKVIGRSLREIAAGRPRGSDPHAKTRERVLNFSKASLGETHVKLETVNVAEIVAASLRQEKNEAGLIEVNVPDDLFVQGHFTLLQRAVGNLLRNAVRYAGDAGAISVSACRDDDRVVITVSDQGPGVSPHELEKLFDPFYRVDPSRTSETGGVGLGLAIVKNCVEACRGVVNATIWRESMTFFRRNDSHSPHASKTCHA